MFHTSFAQPFTIFLNISQNNEKLIEEGRVEKLKSSRPRRNSFGCDLPNPQLISQSLRGKIAVRIAVKAYISYLAVRIAVKAYISYLSYEACSKEKFTLSTFFKITFCLFPASSSVALYLAILSMEHPSTPERFLHWASYYSPAFIQPCPSSFSSSFPFSSSSLMHCHHHHHLQPHHRFHSDVYPQHCHDHHLTS